MIECLHMKLKRHVQMNFLKNILIIIFALGLLPILAKSIHDIQLEQSSNLLLVISMLLVTVCFANFEFTYAKSEMNKPSGTFLALCSTFIFMFLIAIQLEYIVLIIKEIYPTVFPMFVGMSVLLYIGMILYDFWDLVRMEQRIEFKYKL